MLPLSIPHIPNKYREEKIFMQNTEMTLKIALWWIKRKKKKSYKATAVEGNLEKRNIFLHKTEYKYLSDA